MQVVNFSDLKKKGNGMIFIHGNNLSDPCYILPFKSWETLIELGGGEKPVLRPNVDIRDLPTVDIVADLEKPFPLDSNHYDGVISKYMIEHINFQKVEQFISETYRILKPGGYAVILTANLLEQAKVLVGEKEWSLDFISMIFGSQGFPANTHRTGFSPEFATSMFKQAGFIEIEILPVLDSFCHGLQYGAMNMVITAKKSVDSCDSHFFTENEIDEHFKWLKNRKKEET